MQTDLFDNLSKKHFGKIVIATSETSRKILDYADTPLAAYRKAVAEGLRSPFLVRITKNGEAHILTITE